MTSNSVPDGDDVSVIADTEAIKTPDAAFMAEAGAVAPPLSDCARTQAMRLLLDITCASLLLRVRRPPWRRASLARISLGLLVGAAASALVGVASRALTLPPPADLPLATPGERQPARTCSHSSAVQPLLCDMAPWWLVLVRMVSAAVATALLAGAAHLISHIAASRRLLTAALPVGLAAHPALALPAIAAASGPRGAGSLAVCAFIALAPGLAAWARRAALYQPAVTYSTDAQASVGYVVLALLGCSCAHRMRARSERDDRRCDATTDSWRLGTAAGLVLYTGRLGSWSLPQWRGCTAVSDPARHGPASTLSVWLAMLGDGGDASSDAIMRVSAIGAMLLWHSGQRCDMY